MRQRVTHPIRQRVTRLTTEQRRRRPRYDGAVPGLVCPDCGKRIYTTATLDTLFADERRCPRCGADLRAERRELERREAIRRQNEARDTPPPPPENRLDDRRKKRRRRPGADAKKRSDLGWQD
jgi:transcription initiation factor IIE alpha subunit